MKCKWYFICLSYIIINARTVIQNAKCYYEYGKLLQVRNFHKSYGKDGMLTKALRGITFDVLPSEYLGIMGASGSGKTILLNCIAAIIKSTSCQILLYGANISAFDGNKLA